jgi:hypothetical protein
MYTLLCNKGKLNILLAFRYNLITFALKLIQLPHIQMKALNLPFLVPNFVDLPQVWPRPASCHIFPIYCLTLSRRNVSVLYKDLVRTAL